LLITEFNSHEMWIKNRAGQKFDSVRYTNVSVIIINNDCTVKPCYRDHHLRKNGRYSWVILISGWS